MITITRLVVLVVAILGITGLAGTALQADEAELPKSEDGLHIQTWFKQNSFFDLSEDVAEARDANKLLVLLFEQRGCPYCREMHRVNFRIPEIADYIKSKFDVLQFNLWGDREVTSVEGESLTEKSLARKLRVQYTPTTVFLDETGKEVFRMPGYFKPFHFLSHYEYVATKGYAKEPNFQRWIQAKAEHMEAEGKEIRLWD